LRPSIFIHLPHDPAIGAEIAMRRHDAFASEELLRYTAECERMARLAVPVKRKTGQVRNVVLLPLCFGLVANVIVLASS
jgi:hypothetical protein